MRVICQHGYFKFFEDAPGEIAKFNTIYGQDLKLHKDYFTFSELTELPEHSIKGKTFVDSIIATSNFYGEPWEVLEANNLVYDFTTKLIANINTTGSYFKKSISTSGYYTSNGLILPGSYSDDGQKVKGYYCKFDFSSLLFKYMELKV